MQGSCVSCEDLDHGGPPPMHMCKVLVFTCEDLDRGPLPMHMRKVLAREFQE